MEDKNKAIFWDRDGVLNYVVEQRDDGLLNVSPQKFEDFKLVEGVSDVLSSTQAMGYLNIIATKQPDIARNKLSWEELNRMHDFLKVQVPTITAIYVCPHDEKDNCNCRKPKPGLLLDAKRDYYLDIKKCFMVGDSQSDIDAGKMAGVKTVLVSTKYNNKVKDFDYKITSIQELIQVLG